jgi:XapX domain-containing protein
MKALLLSFVVGLFVGVIYGVIRVKSPAPPIVALLLFGMVLGEQAGGMAYSEEGPIFKRGSTQRPDAQSVISSPPAAKAVHTTLYPANSGEAPHFARNFRR